MAADQESKSRSEPRTGHPLLPVKSCFLNMPKALKIAPAAGKQTLKMDI